MRIPTVLATLAFMLIAAFPALAQETDPLSLAIADRVQEADGRWADAGDKRQIALITDYDAVGYAPIWVGPDGINDKGRDLIEIFRGAAADGLHPQDYLTPEIEVAVSATTDAGLADLEIRLSTSLLTYAQHIRSGRVEPNAINRDLKIFPEGPDPENVLADARTTNDMAAFSASLAPPTPRYARLKDALIAYQRLADAGGWPEVPPPTTGKSLKPGMSDPMVPVLAKRLEKTGELAAGAFVNPAEEPDLYSDALVEAVQRFQALNGLEIDGVVGPNTLKQINITAAQRVAQIELNLERRRWMADDLGKYYVFVNLADQYLKVVQLVDKNGAWREKTIHAARTVVGKTYHKTPVFNELMTYVVLNPNWNVPYSIATREYLPKLQRDPGALARQNIRVLSGGREIYPYAVNWSAYSRGNFPFRLQQAAGPRNALGRVKFMFPNKYNIYIHDTPSKSLFERASRAYSHGCVRVQDPLTLAEVLLEHEGMSRADIDRIVNRGKRRVVKFQNPIPVHITYLTAWVNKDGSLHFRRDIYGRDKILAKALQRVETAAN